MDVQIVVFPETRVAAIEHFGPPALEQETVKKLVAWKLEHRLLDPAKHRHYGVHYTGLRHGELVALSGPMESRTAAPLEHHVDICMSIDQAVGPNSAGIIEKVIPRCRCALARDIGSPYDNQAATYLYEQWLPRSGELPGDFPAIFHYVNVGPHVREADMITDVYLPLK